MTKEGLPCEFPFTDRGVEYTDSCVFQPRYFWFPSYHWCYIGEGKRGVCDTSVTCETSTDAEDVATETVGKLVTGTEELNCKLKEEVSANYRVK